MKEIQYIVAKIISRLKREKHKETVLNYFRKEGIQIGGGVNICSNIVTTESHLISIGDNTTIAGNVTFVTHDHSIAKVIKGTSDLFGRITIGKNCFIGSNAVILYGVTLCDNIIVAAGSVVANSFHEERIIIAGNPARKISTWEKFAEKSEGKAWNLGNMTREEEIKLHQADYRLIER